MAALALGIVAIAGFVFAGPFAWFLGRRSLTAIQTSPGRYRGKAKAMTGYVLGIIGTCLLVLAGLYLLALYRALQDLKLDFFAE